MLWVNVRPVYIEIYTLFCAKTVNDNFRINNFEMLAEFSIVVQIK